MNEVKHLVAWYSETGGPNDTTYVGSYNNSEDAEDAKKRFIDSTLNELKAANCSKGEIADLSDDMHRCIVIKEIKNF